MTYSTIRDAIKTRLETIAGLRAYDTAPNEVNPPVAVVLPGNPVVTFGDFLAGQAEVYNFNVRVLVGAAVDRASQDNLDGYLDGNGAASIRAAIDGNLGGAALLARVTQARNYRDYEVAGVAYLGVEFVVAAQVWGPQPTPHVT